MLKKKKKETSLFPGGGKQLRAFRYFEMKLLPWGCFHIFPLIMMGNKGQYSSENSRNKGNKGRKMELDEQVPKKGLISSVKTLSWLHSRGMWGVGRSAVFSKGQGSQLGWRRVILRWGGG